MIGRKAIPGLILIAAILLPQAQAQFESATVLGRVVDTSGGVVRGCAVSLKNLDTGVTAKTKTGESGDYQFLNVRAGRYQETAEATGFSASVTDSIEVTVNARQRVDIVLRVGETHRQVEVRDAATILETDSSDRGQVVGRQAVAELPLNGRASADLMLLAPGVRRSAITTRESSFNINGLRSAFNNFVLDGVDNNAYGTSNQGYSNQVIQLSPDAVEEFRVQTSNYSAEFGRAMGAVVNATMRSGGNNIHGAAWEYLRNTKLNAVGFFQPVGGVKPVLVQNQFGAATGGPVIKNRLFYFADYEGFRQVTRQVAYASVPTSDQRQGRFAGPVRNPYTGELYSDGVIPQSAITAFARKVMNDLPPTNLPGTSNNLQTMPRGSTQDDKGDARIDHYHSGRLTFFGRFSNRLNTAFAPANIPGPSGGNSNGNTRTMNRQIATGATWTLTPFSLIEARFGYSITEGGKTPIDLGGKNMLQLYGISGLPEDPGIAGGLNTQQISGLSNLGRQGTNPQHQDPTVVNPNTTVL